MFHFVETATSQTDISQLIVDTVDIILKFKNIQFVVNSYYPKKWKGI